MLSNKLSDVTVRRNVVYPGVLRVASEDDRIELIRRIFTKEREIQLARAILLSKNQAKGVFWISTRIA